MTGAEFGLLCLAIALVYVAARLRRLEKIVEKKK